MYCGIQEALAVAHSLRLPFRVCEMPWAHQLRAELGDLRIIKRPHFNFMGEQVADLSDDIEIVAHLSPKQIEGEAKLDFGAEVIEERVYIAKKAVLLVFAEFDHPRHERVRKLFVDDARRDDCCRSVIAPVHFGKGVLDPERGTLGHLLYVGHSGPAFRKGLLVGLRDFGIILFPCLIRAMVRLRKEGEEHVL